MLLLILLLNFITFWSLGAAGSQLIINAPNSNYFLSQILIVSMDPLTVFVAILVEGLVEGVGRRGIALR